MWDLASKKVVHSYDDHTGSISTVAFHPDGTCVASAGGQNGRVASHVGREAGHEVRAETKSA